MATFNYEAIDNKTGERVSGVVQSATRDLAIGELQKRNLIIASIQEEGAGLKLRTDIAIFQRVRSRDLVILSKQLATLFKAQVSALQIFRLIAAEQPNDFLHKTLTNVANDIQGGDSIADSLARHPKVFSAFYVNMVRAGEESGQLDTIFGYLADYIDRSYQVTSKARNALVYPAFVVTAFIAVMFLMFTMIIPKISDILRDSGQELPIYTKIVIGISAFFVNFWWAILIVLVGGTIGLIYFTRTPDGRVWWSRFKLAVPVIGTLYQKLYLSRLTDNMHTMLLAGIQMTRSLEITRNVMDDATYEAILETSLEEVKGGATLSQSLADYKEIPGILVQMIKVGEESGELGSILSTMAEFYQREVNNAVDTLVGLIEPAMIVVLGVGVGILLASVLMPIYNIAGSF